MNTEDDFNIRDVRMLENGRKYENVLRPLSLHGFSGQTKAVKNPKVLVMAARMRKEALDHVLLHGPPGLGKATLSNIIANELGVGFKVTSGSVSDKLGDLAGALISLKKNDVLFINETHRLNPIVEEHLHPAMEDYRVDIVIDKGSSTHSIQIDLAPFTLIGVMTRSGLLISPLRTCFGISMYLKYCDMETLMKIVLHSASILNIKCELNAVREVASRSRDTPRIVSALLHHVHDFAQVKGNGDTGKAIACFSLEALNIDRYGLDQIDNKLLTTIVDKFQGGPVGLAAIATALGEDPGTLKEVYEPFLIKEGFIRRTPHDREATDLAYIHLGRSWVGGQGLLFD